VKGLNNFASSDLHREKFPTVRYSFVIVVADVTFDC